MKKRIAVLVSTRGWGTNSGAIIKAVKLGKLDAEIFIVSTSKEAPGFIFARENKIPAFVLDKEEDIVKFFKEKPVDYIALTGWPRIIPKELIELFSNRILNIHPGLIPDSINGKVKNPDGTEGIWNKGKLTDDAIKSFLDSRVAYAGSSLHFLTEEFDFGPVLGRVFEKIRKEDTTESLYRRLKKKENALFVKGLVRLCKKTQKLGGKTVLVVDMAGRGSALVDKYARSKRVEKILAVPGNDLMGLYTKKEVKTYPYLKTTSVKEIIEICKKEKVDFVDVAQDDAVGAGVTDAILELNIAVCGPTKNAGRIEWDKAWAREFMKKYSLPTPLYKICNSEKEGLDFIKKQKENKWFVKANGLVGGKGALPAETNEKAIERIKEMKKFGDAGKTFVIEEWLEGEEFSLFALSDGEHYQIVGAAQDHKRMYNGDLGENTGGMGCSTPPLVLSKKILEKTDKQIIKKTLEGLKKEGFPYKGVLYLGGILVGRKVYIIEFNARWGDPEAEVLVPSIKTDYFEISEAIAEGKLNKVSIRRDNLSRVSVALALKENPSGTPGKFGRRFYGLDEALKIPGVLLYGTRITKVGNKYYAGSGRLLHVVGEGKTVMEAREKAYHAVSLFYIEGNNLHFRTDIGWRDVERMRKVKTWQ